MDGGDRLSIIGGSADQPVVRASGELDAYTADRLEQHLVSARRDRPGRNLHLDLSAITFVDSTGLRVLVAANNDLRETGASLVIVEPSRAVARLLELTALDSILRTERRIGGA